MSLRPVAFAGAALIGMSALAGIATWMAWPYLSPHSAGRVHYIASESMMPTLVKGDRVAARVTDPAALLAGTIVMIRTSGADRILRVIGRSGETVALSGGRVSIDGRAALLVPRGRGPMLTNDEPTTLMQEQLPGEPRPHYVLDTSDPSHADMPPVRVPAGRLFLLGDNRDRAADSRFGPDEYGVGMVATAQVIGVIGATLRSARDGKTGEMLDHLPETVLRKSQ